MRGEDCDASILKGIKAFVLSIKYILRAERKSEPFDQNEVIRRKPIKVFPLLFRIILDAHHRSLRIWVNERDRESVIFDIDASVVAETERPVNGRVRDGPPEVDDLKSAA